MVRLRVCLAYSVRKEFALAVATVTRTKATK
jgi:hypothetical protein